MPGALIGIAIVVLLIAAYYRRESFGPQMINPRRVVRLHHTKSCPHCVLMWPVWQRVKLAAPPGIIFEEIDEDLVKTPGIRSVPIIRMIDERGRLTEYHGGPSFEVLRNWVIQPRPVRF
jgi:hypothetical protein